MPLAIKQTDSVTFTEPMLLARPEHLAVVPFEETKTESNKLELPNEKILEIITEEEPVVDAQHDSTALVELGTPSILTESSALIDLSTEDTGFDLDEVSFGLVIILGLSLIVIFVLHYFGFG